MAPKKGVKRSNSGVEGQAGVKRSNSGVEGQASVKELLLKRSSSGVEGQAPAKRPASAPAPASAPSSTLSKSPSASKLAAGSLVEGLRDAGWKKALVDEFEKPYFVEIDKFVAAERAKFSVHPAAEKVFEAFNVTPFDEVKVVILGQDPYHEPGQAHGLCFSVLPGVKPPPSLKNMYTELAADISGFEAPDHGHLLDWARQGVLMLNATLTVREGHKEANSHAKCGWQKFTDEAIRALNAREKGCVFLLWGGFAQKKGKLVDTSKHKVVESAHPSPLSVTKWRGCRTFSKCNAALKALGYTEIDWRLK